MEPASVRDCLYTVDAPDVSGINAHLVDPGFHRGKRYSVVKVNIGDYRDINRVFQRGNEPDVLNGRYRCTDYLAARRFKLLSLPYCAFYVPAGMLSID